MQLGYSNMKLFRTKAHRVGYPLRNYDWFRVASIWKYQKSRGLSDIEYQIPLHLLAALSSIYTMYNVMVNLKENSSACIQQGLEINFESLVLDFVGCGYKSNKAGILDI